MIKPSGVLDGEGVVVEQRELVDVPEVDLAVGEFDLRSSLGLLLWLLLFSHRMKSNKDMLHTQ